MKCITCSLEGDKNNLYRCDCCKTVQCKECGAFSASEERCFPLSKRKVVLLCPQCREQFGNLTELMQLNRKLKQDIELIKESLLEKNDVIATLNKAVEDNIEINAEKNDGKEMLIKQNDELKAKNLFLENEMSSLEQENEELKESIENQHKSQKKLVNDINKLNSINETLRNENAANATRVKTANVNVSKDELNKESIVNELYALLSNKLVKDIENKMVEITNKIDNKLNLFGNNLETTTKSLTYSEVAKDPNKGNKDLKQGNLLTEQHEYMKRIINLPITPNNENSSTIKEREMESHQTNQQKYISNKHILTNKNTQKKSKEPIIVGTAKPENSSKFTGKAQNAWLFVTRVSKGTDEKDIEKYLNLKYQSEKFTVENLNSKSEYHDSFKIRANLSLVDELMKPEVWPGGVIVKRYRFFPGKQNVGYFGEAQGGQSQQQ